MTEVTPISPRPIAETLSRAGLIGLALLLGGCLQTRSGLRSRVGDKQVAKRSQEDSDALPSRWRRVGLGFPKKDTLGGYTRTDLRRVKGQEPFETHWVYDKDFTKLGFYTGLGATYKKQASGDYELLGSFAVGKSVTLILGQPGPVNFYAMTPPRGQNIPFEDLLERKPRNPTPPKGEGDES